MSLIDLQIGLLRYPRQSDHVSVRYHGNDYIDNVSIEAWSFLTYLIIYNIEINTIEKYRNTIKMKLYICHLRGRKNICNI